MDFTKFDQATLNVQKTPAVTTVVLTAKAKADAGELADLWAASRSGLLAQLQALGVDLSTQAAGAQGEDVQLALQKREIRAMLRFQPKPPAKA